MIDIHAHILPSMDEHVSSRDDALEAIKMAVADGIHTIICTPYMGLDKAYASAGQIKQAFTAFEQEVSSAGYPVQLGLGADIAMHDGLLEGLQQGKFLTLSDSRYFLLRTGSESLPFNFRDQIKAICTAGYIPIITHPERSSWIHNQYNILKECVELGAWVQVTGDCLTGHMGRKSRYWAERLLGEGIVHVLATDTHGVDFQAPVLSDARACAEKIIGEQEADLLVTERPLGVINDLNPEVIPMPPGLEKTSSALTA